MDTVQYPTIPIFNDRVFIYHKDWKERLKKYLDKHPKKRHITTITLQPIIIDNSKTFLRDRLNECLKY